MNFATCCSGIEAPSVAWHPLGWRPQFFSEIEAFPCSVLKHHYPLVPNHGDMLQHHEWPRTTLDVLCAGTPCQAFSVAGLRKGLADPRGNLTLGFLGVIEQFAPTWVVWENVPGVLSVDGGRAFGAFLGGLGHLGYGFAYTVLDAQWFGLAQRRKRVFVVAHSGGAWQRAAAVLFDRESLCGNPPPRRETWEGTAPTISARTQGGGGLGTDAECDGAVIPIQEIGKRQSGTSMNGVVHGSPGDPMFTLQSNVQHGIAHSLKADGFDASEDGTGRGTPLVPEVAWALQERDSKGVDSDTKDGHLLAVSLHENQRGEISQNETTGALGQGGGKPGQGYPAVAFERRMVRTTGGQPQEELQHALRSDNNSGDGAPCVSHGMAVRRLTPRECERLQGFPDDYTLVPHRGKPASDGPRYKALGNSIAVPVIRWIGERIDLLCKR